MVRHPTGTGLLLSHLVQQVVEGIHALVLQDVAQFLVRPHPEVHVVQLPLGWADGASAWGRSTFTVWCELGCGALRRGDPYGSCALLTGAVDRLCVVAPAVAPVQETVECSRFMADGKPSEVRPLPLSIGPDIAGGAA